MTKKRICDAAVEILRETVNPAVMFGDVGLLDAIDIRAGHTDKKSLPWVRHRRVLNALRRQPGILVCIKTMIGSRAVNKFVLPEAAYPAGSN